MAIRQERFGRTYDRDDVFFTMIVAHPMVIAHIPRSGRLLVKLGRHRRLVFVGHEVVRAHTVR